MPAENRTAAGVRRPVEGRYKLLGANLVGVELAAYDRSRTLTIDPVLVYSSLLGGSGSDAITAVKLDRAGNIDDFKGCKHAYGIAFGIYACAAYHAATD